MSSSFEISATITRIPLVFDEFLFIFSGQRLDLMLPLQSIGVAAAGFPVHQLQRCPAPGIFCTPAGTMGFQPLFHIGSDAGIEGVVFTSEDV